MCSVPVSNLHNGFLFFYLVSASQDIRNIIPFSGRGFLLGGSTPSSTSIQKPPIQSPPCIATPSPTLAQEPAKTPPTVLIKRSVSNHKAFVNINGSPVRITKNNGSLVRPKQRTVQDIFHKLSSPQKAKSNTSKPEVAFTSTNQRSYTQSSGGASKPLQGINSPKTGILNKNTSGSPVRPKSVSVGSPYSKYFRSPQGSGGSSSANSQAQIRTDRENSNSSSKSGGGILTSAVQIKTEAKIPNSRLNQFGSQEHSSSTGTENSSSANSKQFKSSDRPETGSRVPASISRAVGSPIKSESSSGAQKRFREDQNTAHIFDFFQRVSQSSTASCSRAQCEDEAVSDAPASRASGTSSTSVSSALLTVRCPVCQTKVLDLQINHHLDSCLT